MALTEKQKRFCEEYLIDLNATQAAIRAGYSEKAAKEIACENLTKPNIQKKIACLQAEQSQRTAITADMVANAIAEIAFAKEDEKTSDRIKALELLGKHLGMFKDKVEVSGLQKEQDKLDEMIRQMKT